MICHHSPEESQCAQWGRDSRCKSHVERPAGVDRVEHHQVYAGYGLPIAYDMGFTSECSHQKPMFSTRFVEADSDPGCLFVREVGSTTQHYLDSTCKTWQVCKPAPEHKHKHGMSEKLNFCPRSPMALEGPSQLLVASLPNAAQRGREATWSQQLAPKWLTFT